MERMLKVQMVNFTDSIQCHQTGGKRREVVDYGNRECAGE